MFCKTYLFRLLLVSCGTLISSHSFDVRSDEIRFKSLTMILAIEKIMEDSISKQSNLLFITEQTTVQSHEALKPNELLDELLKFMSNQTMITLVIDTFNNLDMKINNNLIIVDSFIGFW